MDKKEILQTIQEAKSSSKKRKFNQTVDLVINLQGLDLKKLEHNVNAFVFLPFSKGRQNKIGAIVGDDLLKKAKESCDVVLYEKDFGSLAENKKKLKKLAKKIDFFIGQADLMPKIASSLGKILGPIGKMPNPKAGCIVPPAIPNLKSICDKLRNTVRLQTKNELSVKAPVGRENNKEEELAENILLVYNTVLHSLPQEKDNIKDVIIKLTMGEPFVVGKKIEIKAEEKLIVEKKAEPKKTEKPKQAEEKKEVKKKPKKVKDGKA